MYIGVCVIDELILRLFLKFILLGDKKRKKKFGSGFSILFNSWLFIFIIVVDGVVNIIVVVVSKFS